MIDYIRGSITDLTPASVTIETYGIGYLINISLSTYTFLQGKDEALVYIYEAIREDSHTLYGFFDKHEREIFVHLISVSGVGPSTGRMILSSLSSQEVESVIASENATALQTVKGIGAKTAQRIILDLKDKIKYTGAGTTVTVPAATFASAHGQEAVSALVMLGFTKAASEKVVAKITKATPNLTVEAIIKQALKTM